MLRLTLSESDVKKLELEARQQIGRVSERIHFVLLCHRGYSAPQIGELFNYTEETVRSWLKRYQEQGLSGLIDEPRSGRPPKDPLLNGVVECQIGQSPRCFGYLRSFWTILALTAHLASYLKIKVSSATVRRAVTAIGYSWRRPRLSPVKKSDPNHRTRLAVILALLRAVLPECHLLFEDESDLELLPVLRAMWMRGEQKRIPTPGQNKKLSLFGALDIRTGAWHYLTRSTKRSTDFIALLEQICLAYPTGLLILMVDNATIHTSKAVQTWLKNQPRVHLVFLPKYSAADFNPVEKVWWLLKGVISANWLYKNVAEIETEVHRFFQRFSPQAALQLVDADGLPERLANALLPK